MRPLVRIVVLLGALCVTLGVAEVALRLAGFSYQLRARVIESTAPNRQRAHEGYVLDRELFWTPKDYETRLEEARVERPAILFLGDSCTEFGTYPEEFAARVRAAASGPAQPVMKFGCAGYTTRQGLALLTRDILKLRPGVVAFYYGWNDHWLSIGVTDDEIARLNTPFLFRLQKLRLVQLAVRGYVGARLRLRGGPPPRVPEAAFRRNLVEMVHRCRTAGISPVLITAPTAHEPGFEPPELAGRWVRDLKELVPLHRRYQDIVRQVARTEGAVLCDAGAAFERIPGAERRGRLFYADGIHLTPEGSRVLAGELLDCFAAAGLTGGAGR